MEVGRYGVFGAAAVLIALAMWLLWGGRVEGAVDRRRGRGEDRPRGSRLVQWRDSMTNPTRLTFALSMLLLGYHLAAWTAPAHVLPFRIPLDLWFLLVGGAGLACVSSLWLDRRQAADEGEM